jgi:hypothetical protein
VASGQWLVNSNPGSKQETVSGARGRVLFRGGNGLYGFDLEAVAAEDLSDFFEGEEFHLQVGDALVDGHSNDAFVALPLPEKSLPAAGVLVVVDVEQEEAVQLEETGGFFQQGIAGGCGVEHAEGAEEAEGGVEAGVGEGERFAQIGVNPSGGKVVALKLLSGLLEHWFGEIHAGAGEAALGEGQQAASGSAAEVDDRAGLWQLLGDELLIGLGEGRVADLVEILPGEIGIVEVFPQPGRDAGRKLPIRGPRGVGHGPGVRVETEND